MARGRKKKGDALTVKKKFIWDDVKKSELKRIMDVAEEYKGFLNAAKTERESVRYLVSMASENGFKDISKVKKARKGTRLYITYRDKVVALCVVGRRPLEAGLNIVASHIDAPRLDLKPYPLHEDKDTGICLFKTHYYGGIKKYSWGNIPLAIHGTVVKEDGTRIDINIGEDEDDPVFLIPDLAPHLYKNIQAKRKLPDGLKGEELRVIISSMKLEEKAKLWVLNHLHERYGIVEEDLVSAEIEIVPAYKARDVGLDRSMIGAYGQDDRICAFTTARAIMDVARPERTCLALFFDKEEIGSSGATGADSFLMEHIFSKIFSAVYGEYSHAQLKEAMENSYCLSADVSTAINPVFKDVQELQNEPALGRGIVVTKYTGHGGKYSASDANPEFVAKLRRVFNREKIFWQSGELGKVDEGGGGTIAKYLARFAMEVLDCGPGLISMHAPYEISSKADVYNAVRAYRAFLEKMA